MFVYRPGGTEGAGEAEAPPKLLPSIVIFFLPFCLLAIIDLFTYKCNNPQIWYRFKPILVLNSKFLLVGPNHGGVSLDIYFKPLHF